jgi:hypothetical protein
MGKKKQTKFATGAEVGSAKFTAHQVANIRNGFARKLQTEGLSFWALCCVYATRYNVTHMTIMSMVSGKTYRKVGGKRTVRRHEITEDGRTLKKGDFSATLKPGRKDGSTCYANTKEVQESKRRAVVISHIKRLPLKTFRDDACTQHALTLLRRCVKLHSRVEEAQRRVDNLTAEYDEAFRELLQEHV